MTVRLQLVVVTLSLLSLWITAGCDKAANDKAESNSESVSKGANEAMDQAANAGKQIGAATMLTPRLKTEITSDPKLNDASNSIDVDSTPDAVTLRGYVATEELRMLAERVVLEEMKQAKATHTLRNELVVRS